MRIPLDPAAARSPPRLAATPPPRLSASPQRDFEASVAASAASRMLETAAATCAMVESSRARREGDADILPSPAIARTADVVPGTSPPRDPWGVAYAGGGPQR